VRPALASHPRRGLALLVPALLFGFLVTVQWGTEEARRAAELQMGYAVPLTGAAQSLQDQQEQLKAELASLRAQLDEIQDSAAKQSAAAGELQARLDELKRGAGLVGESGEGILAVLDEARPAALETEKPFCRSTDLIDLVNTAWRGGARAVALNAERIVASSSIYCVGATTIVNGTVVDAPFTVSAVGPQAQLLAAFEDPALLPQLKRPGEAPAFRVTRAANVHIPPYSGAVLVRFAVPQ
jgi:uncharacterized protein YlxW (UPF0749 family)